MSDAFSRNMKSCPQCGKGRLAYFEIEGYKPFWACDNCKRKFSEEEIEYGTGSYPK